MAGLVACTDGPADTSAAMPFCERETDEYVLEVGCGEGLISYREWLYERVDDDTEAQKRIDYYSPEEIEAWMASQP